MRTIKVAVLMGLTMLFGAGCSGEPAVQQEAAQQPVPAGYVVYTSPQGWVLNHPKEWTVTPVPNATQTFFYPPYDAAKASFSHNLNVVVTPNQKEVLPLETLRSSVVEYLTNTYRAQITESKVVTHPLGNVVSISYVVPATQEGDVTLYGRQIGLYEGTTLYVLTFTAGKDGYDAYAETVQSIFNSFRTAAGS